MNAILAQCGSCSMHTIIVIFHSIFFCFSFALHVGILTFGPFEHRLFSFHSCFVFSLCSFRFSSLSSFSINVHGTLFFFSTIYFRFIRILLIRSFSICSIRYLKIVWMNERKREEAKKIVRTREMICSAFECIGNSLASAKKKAQKTNGIARLLSSILAIIIIIIIIFQCNFINYSRDYHVSSSTRAPASTCAGCRVLAAGRVSRVKYYTEMRSHYLIWVEVIFTLFLSIARYKWNLMLAIIYAVPKLCDLYSRSWVIIASVWIFRANFSNWIGFSFHDYCTAGHPVHPSFGQVINRHTERTPH